MRGEGQHNFTPLSLHLEHYRSLHTCCTALAKCLTGIPLVHPNHLQLGQLFLASSSTTTAPKRSEAFAAVTNTQSITLEHLQRYDAYVL
jgi:hypothetical protein